MDEDLGGQSCGAVMGLAIPVPFRFGPVTRTWTPEETEIENRLTVQCVALVKVAQRRGHREDEAVLRQVLAGLAANESERLIARLGGALQWR